MVKELSKLIGEMVGLEEANLIAVFQKTLASKPIKNCPAVIYERQVYTFQELDDVSTSLSATIVDEIDWECSAGRDVTPVLVCLPPSEKMVALLFAILKFGGSYVPIDPSTPQKRMEEILKVIGYSTLVITNSEFAHKFKKCRVLQIKRIFEEAAEKVCCRDPKQSTWKPSKFPAILYTSGSTGIPKGVLISNRTLMNRLTWQWRTFPFSPKENCCFKTNLTFVDSICEIFGPLLQGYPISVLSKRTVVNPHLLIQNLHDGNITRITLVPSHLKSLLDTIELFGTEGSKFLQNIRLWISSGEVLRMTLIEQFFKFFPTAQLCNFYGSTEVMGDVTFETFSSLEAAVETCADYSVSIGRPIQNAEIHILDENAEMVGCGEIGEICVSGMLILNEVFPGQSQTNTKETTYRTGDLGFVKILETGEQRLFYLGRKDKNVKIRGQKVNLNAVEGEILKLPSIDAVKVLMRESNNNDSELIAFIAGSEQINSKHIRNELLSSNFLKSHEIPQAIHVLAKLPMMLNGKVDSQKLLVLCGNSTKRNLDFPNGPFHDLPLLEYELAKRVVSALAQVTGADAQDIMENMDASFNEIGGNSLNMVTAVLEMKKSGINIDLATFIGAPNIQNTIEFVLSENIRPTRMLTSQHGPKFIREEIQKEHLPFVKKLMRRVCCTEVDCSDLKHSFVARRQADGILAGLSINTIIKDTSTCLAQGKNAPYLLQLVYEAEAQARAKLIGMGRILHNLNVEVSEDFEKGSEKVSVLLYLEEENILFAREKECTGVLTTNTSIVTQEICSELLEYETLTEVQTASFVAQDGSKPFVCSPAGDKIVCCFKQVPGTK